MPNPSIPATGKSVILGYSANDRDWPIIGVRRDPNVGVGMTVPVMGAAHPETAKFPNHVFTGVKVENIDAESFWTYEILPGPWINGTRIDPDGVTVTVKSRKNVDSSITTGEVVATDAWTGTRKGASADSYTADEIVESRILKTGTPGATVCPIIASKPKWNETLRVDMSSFWQYVPIGTSLPAIGSTYGTGQFMGHSALASLSITSPGTGYISIPTLAIAAPDGGGTQATGTVTALKVVSGTVAVYGSGHVSGNVITAVGGTHAGGAATFTLGGGMLLTLALNDDGTGYVQGDVITLLGGVATVPATVVATTLYLQSFNVVAKGTAMVAGVTIITMIGGTFTTAATYRAASTEVVSGAVVAGGTTVSPDGTYNVAGTTGVGTKFAASVTVVGGTITGIVSFTNPGHYLTNPTSIAVEPVVGTGGFTVTGATLSVVMGINSMLPLNNGGTYTVSSTTLTSTGGGNDATFNAAYFRRTWVIQNPGNFTTTASDFTQASTTGSGVGATFDTPTYQLALTLTSGGLYTVIPATSPAATTSSGPGTGMTLVLDFGIGAVSLGTAGTTYYGGNPYVAVSYGNAVITAVPGSIAEITGTGYVREHALLDTEHALIKRMTWLVTPTPANQGEWANRAYLFPAQLTVLNVIFQERLWPGIHFNMLPHVEGKFAVLEAKLYSESPMTLPQTFALVSPAAGQSAYINVPQKCVHPSFTYYKSESGSIVYQEVFAASTPSYTKGQLIVIGASQRRALGNLWEKTVLVACELHPVYSAPLSLMQ